MEGEKERTKGGSKERRREERKKSRREGRRKEGEKEEEKKEDWCGVAKKHSTLQCTIEFEEMG